VAEQGATVGAVARPVGAGVRARFAWRLAGPRIATVVLYAVGMAVVEAAAVLYLRTIYGGIDPLGPRHSPFDPLPDFARVELVREAATLVMLASVGWLAGRGLGGRVGAFALAMGVWDIGYYVVLWQLSGWPASLLAPDVLFLIPLPWWGPVLAPVLSASIMVLAGAAMLARDLGDGLPRLTAHAGGLILVGVGVCLGAFMADALVALGRGGLAAAVAVRWSMHFPWPLFGLGVLLCTAGLASWLGRSHGPGRGRYLRPSVDEPPRA
jgi:hypothetical protein